MFAGIVEGTAAVIALGAPQGNAPVRLSLESGPLLADAALGASIAVNGVCLTVAARSADAPGCVHFDVVPETLRLTNLGQLTGTQRVNIERSLRLSDRIDGHFVQGHVDGLGDVVEIQRAGPDWRVWIAPPPDLARFIIHKGSIAIDGVSLTIAAVQPERFAVALIPTTLERTTLAALRPGARVNLETDVVVRTLVARIDALWAEHAQARPDQVASPAAGSTRP